MLLNAGADLIMGYNNGRYTLPPFAHAVLIASANNVATDVQMAIPADVGANEL